MRISKRESGKEAKDNMGLYKRDKTYWCSLMNDGKRIRKSLETDNKKLASRLFAKVQTDMIEGRYFEASEAKTRTFDEMVEKYMSSLAHSRDCYTIKPLLGSFGGLTLYQIQTPLVSEYYDERLDDFAEATVYQEMSLLRRMFNVAMKRWKWVKENPVNGISFSVGSRNARDRWLSIEEEARLVANATNPHWLRSFLITALHTGMRRGEILRLTWKDIDFPQRLVRVEKSKNGEKRSIPMSQTLYETLRGIKVRDISGTVFPVSVRSLRVAFENALDKSGIENFRIHDMRHTFATRLVQNGVDLYKVQKLLGHKSITMTQRYAHHYPESLRSSVEVLDVCHNFVTIDTEQELAHPVEPHKIR
jgi:integrase